MLSEQNFDVLHIVMGLISLDGAPRQNFDIVNGVMFDLAAPQGFLWALEQTLRLKPGALLFGGVPCSSPLT